ncbi:hypothetical protein C357_02511 [Citreicella sp. 357]|nr:hypothetical protein C357_02511 [Citreicella sp. 357]
MDPKYPSWLKAQGYQDNTCVAQLHRVQRVEQHYGSLDEALETGQFEAIIGELSYSMDDERHARANPSKIPFQGNIRNNLASYKNAAMRYATFAHNPDLEDRSVPNLVTRRGSQECEDTSSAAIETPERQRLALERDMQVALRRDIAQLDPTLEIIDEGAEHSVDSGFIDILCKNRDGDIVVVELKAGKSDSRVIAQTLGYMGDLITENPETPVQGIIVAHDFDKRTIAAARAVAGLKLARYEVAFSFVFEDDFR